MKLSVYGLIPSMQFEICKSCAKDLYKQLPEIFEEPDIQGMLEFQWTEWLSLKKREHKGEVWGHHDAAIIFIDKHHYLGATQDLLNWAKKTYGYEDFRNEELYETLVQEEYRNYFLNTKNEFVHFDVTQDGQQIGRLLIEIYQNDLPKTCDNFRALCMGDLGRSEDGIKLHYKNSLIHRIVPNGWIQGGDIVAGKGNESVSIYGGHFEDESFMYKHDRRGVVGMANTGRHTNGSQFYITLQPLPFMDKRFVAFGKVIEGSQVLKAIENIATQNQRPIKECVITNCGYLDKQQI